MYVTAAVRNELKRLALGFTLSDFNKDMWRCWMHSSGSKIWGEFDWTILIRVYYFYYFLALYILYIYVWSIYGIHSIFRYLIHYIIITLYNFDNFKYVIKFYIFIYFYFNFCIEFIIFVITLLSLRLLQVN